MNEILTCPKCRGTMRTHTRQGVHVEQCDMCRGIFLDYGELEAINRMGGGGHAPQPPPPAAPPMGHHPAWGHPQHQQSWGHQRHHHQQHGYVGFARMFFSS